MTRIANRDCHDGRNPRFASPTALGTNQLLWADWSKKHHHQKQDESVDDYDTDASSSYGYGILVRAPDMYDNLDTGNSETASTMPTTKTPPLLPASFVHASLRAANSMYPATTQTSAGLLVGSRFSWNNKRQQQFDDDPQSHPLSLVHTSVCYPSDAGSNKRMTALLNDGNTGGRACHPKGISGLCLNNTCLTTHKLGCKCQSHEVPPDNVGSFVADWLPWAGGKQHGLDRFICWYDSHGNNNTSSSSSDHDSHHDDSLFVDTVAASNSLWLERGRWCRRERDEQYMGWTECPATNNIARDHALVDAILVRLPVTTVHNTSLCDYDETVWTSVQTSLEQVKSLGYTNEKPIVFMEQVKGMTNQQECDAYWNGRDCDNGYRKEIYSQEFNFSDGSRLVVPEGCQDVYYFAFDNVTRTCPVTSEVCAMAERQSPHHRKVRHNKARLLQLQEEASILAPFDVPDYAAISLVNLLVLAMSAGTFVFVWRKKRGSRRSRQCRQSG